MKHPAHFFIKALLIKDLSPLRDPAGLNNLGVKKILKDWGFLEPEDSLIDDIRRKIGPVPDGFNPANKIHLESVKFLRNAEVYEYFHSNSAMEEAWDTLTNPQLRSMAEQLLMAKCANTEVLKRVNQQHTTKMSVEGLALFERFFWNVKLLTFDQWGEYLNERTPLYDEYMALLRGDPRVALFKLRVEQAVDSKKMIARSQEIAFFNLEQINQLPGFGPNKIKSMTALAKCIIDADSALSSSSEELTSVLKQFEKFRMEHPQLPAPSIEKLAPVGNYSASGVENVEKALELHRE